MKKSTVLLLLWVALSGYCFGQHLLPGTKPNKTQQKLIERGYGMFMHYGINTFADVEWSDGKLPASTYNPTHLDCDQWVRVARDAGFRYVLLTVKHHDGFCLWDSELTDYDVASSPVKTDVVAQVAKACKKYGIEFAIYYSLWDRHEPCYNDTQKYIGFMLGQLQELLSNYGPVSELWLDGSWVKKPDEWGLEQIYDLMKQLQPHCAMGVNHTIVKEPGKRDLVMPDFMTADDKYHFQYFPSDFRLWDPQIASLNDAKQYLHKGQSYFLPFEHTICLSKRWTWFQKSHTQPVRDIDELEELFYWCTANQNTLVVNIAPDNRGLIRENEANAAIMLGRRLGIKKNKPLPQNGRFVSLNQKCNANSTFQNNDAQFGPSLAVDGGMQTRWAAADTTDQLVIHLPNSVKFDKITIFEYQDRKQNSTMDDFFTNIRVNRIQEYTIDIWKDGAWFTIFHDDAPMGDCKVIRFPESYTSPKVRLNVLKASAPPSIFEFNVIDMGGKK